MRVIEYRKKYPNCLYCYHRMVGTMKCKATGMKMSKWTAKRCPCYTPEKWQFDKEEDNKD